MGDVIDLTIDRGVLKTVLRSAKPGAMQPTEDLPSVDVHYEGWTNLVLLLYLVEVS